MAAKKGAKKKTVRKSKAKPEKEDRSQKILVENFVALQKVMTDLSEKINDLTGQTSRLLNIFEESAKALMEKGGKIDLDSNKEVSEKLNKLLDQNKVLAQGVALLHESSPQNAPQDQYSPQMQPPVPALNQGPQHGVSNKYHRSISSRY